MQIIDRYIARTYLQNIAALFAVIFAFVLTVDLSLNLDRFWRLATESSPRGTSGSRLALVTAFLVWDLWWPRILQLFNFLNGLVLVGAMGFTFRHLVRHRELVAILTAGRSMFRTARPVFVVAALMLLVQAANQEFVVPRLAGDLIRDHGDAGRRALAATSVPLTRDADGRLFHARLFTPDPGGGNRGILEGVYVIERDEQGVATRRITAESAVWRDGGWDLNRGVALAGAGAAGADEPTRRIVTDLDPLALKVERYKGFSQHLSWGQIGQMLARMGKTDTPERARRNTDRLERIRWSRVSAFFATILTLAISLSFFLRRDPSELAGGVMKAAPVTLVALVGGAIGATAPVPGVPPQLSVFIPAMILSPIAIALLTRVRT